MGMGGQRHTPADIPPRNTRYPFYGRSGGPQSWSGRVRKISSPPRLDPRTIQLVASRYTDWAIPARIIGYRGHFPGGKVARPQTG